jgi:hypothetical protein
MAFGALVAVALIAFAPAQVRRLDRLQSSIATQEEIRDDLYAIADRAPCRPLAVPTHRPVPLLAWELDVPPEAVAAGAITRGSYFAPASARVERNFILDRNDPRRLGLAVPPGFEPVARNASWVLHARC